MGIRPSLPTTKVPSVNSKKSPVVVTSSTSSPAALNNSKEDGGEIHVQHGGRMTEVTKKRLTKEDVNLWSKSFDHLMQSEDGRKIFLDYLRSEFSEENILFWLACEDLKKEEDQEKVEEKARLIYEDYISILSPREVSLAGETRAIVNKNMLSPTNQAFEDAQLQIYRLMQRDSYPRFLNSRIYTKLLESQP